MAKKHKPTLSTAAVAARVEMVRRGLTQTDLGRLAGMQQSQVSRAFRGVDTSDAMRRKIENALGMCIWSTPEQFATRQAARQQTQEAAA